MLPETVIFFTGEDASDFSDAALCFAPQENKNATANAGNKNFILAFNKDGRAVRFPYAAPIKKIRINSWDLSVIDILQGISDIFLLPYHNTMKQIARWWYSIQEWCRNRLSQYTWSS